MVHTSKSLFVQNAWPNHYKKPCDHLQWAGQTYGVSAWRFDTSKTWSIILHCKHCTYNWVHAWERYHASRHQTQQFHSLQRWVFEGPVHLNFYNSWRKVVCFSWYSLVSFAWDAKIWGLWFCLRFLAARNLSLQVSHRETSLQKRYQYSLECWYFRISYQFRPITYSLSKFPERWSSKRLDKETSNLWSKGENVKFQRLQVASVVWKFSLCKSPL